MKEKPMTRSLTLTALLLVALPLAAQTPGGPPRPGFLSETVTVSGTGKSMVIPDRFSFTAGVQTNGPSVDDAVQQNNRISAAVIAALKKAGTTDGEIRTSGFSVYPQMDYGEGRKIPTVTGYQVSNNVTVTKSTAASAGPLIQVAVNAGANQVSGLAFTVADPAKGRDEGLQSAFADAKAKATVLAQAAGRSLGRTLTVTEGGVEAPPRPIYTRSMVAQGAAAGVDVPVESGTQELTYGVTVVFELR
jgi:uncharacterized protein YggE